MPGMRGHRTGRRLVGIGYIIAFIAGYVSSILALIIMLAYMYFLDYRRKKAGK